MKFEYNDGGREAAGYKGDTGDCVTRAICIAARLPYDDVYDRLSEGVRTQRGIKHPSARHGIYTERKWFKEYMVSLGFEWTPTMRVGSGCKVHLKEGELPMGRLVVCVSKHYVAVIDNVIYDTEDCSREGKRCVYGYWKLKDNL